MWFIITIETLILLWNKWYQDSLNCNIAELIEKVWQWKELRLGLYDDIEDLEKEIEKLEKDLEKIRKCNMANATAKNYNKSRKEHYKELYLSLIK